ncbi:DUF5681 domain-containing protein [Croceibacterium sp. TMG7-5b_MA50]|uniref:DUF5681 domain-containing protein n=1 Tax=Croceibacterium sp. TMG7-5b_MA50 TaxID=3121290 RepID=UPI0032214FEC
MADDREDGYEVGYGKPPRHSRFQPGVSGNPKGRPRGARGLKAELKSELDEYVTVTENGRPRRLRKRRLIIKALAAKAAKGNVAAADKLLSLVIQAEGFEDERPAERRLSDTEALILEQFLTGHAAEGNAAEPLPAAGGDEHDDADGDRRA